MQWHAPHEEAAMGLDKLLGNAFGAGLVLVVVPSAALYYGAGRFSEHPTVGLSLLAIFGIMILFGSMALTASLFSTLGLHDRNEALGLPAGSVRAAIALSLVVLFATIAIMLFQSLARPDGKVQRLEGLSEEDKTLVLKQPGARVIGVRKVACGPAGAPPAPAAAATTAAAPTVAAACFDVDLLATPGPEAVDVAKQLLTLIGTLMTSVTSFYFASRAAEASAKANNPPPGAATAATAPPSPGPAAPAAAAVAAAPTHHHGGGNEHEDGCDVDIADPTRDEDLPAAKGGVA
jgi:hypothetical protein